MRCTQLPTDVDGFPVDTLAILVTRNWLDVLARPEAYAALHRPVDAAVRTVLLRLLDVWIDYVDRGDWYLHGDPPDEGRPALARELRALVEAWTPPELPAAMTTATRALLDAEGDREQRRDRGGTWDDATVGGDPTRNIDTYLVWPEGLEEVLPMAGATAEQKAARDAKRRIEIRRWLEATPEPAGGPRSPPEPQPGAIATSLPAAAPRRMSLDEWASLSDDEPGELVDGALVEEEVADGEHEDTVAWLMLVLGPWVVARGGRIHGSGGKYAVWPGRGRKADLSVFFPGTPRPARHGPATLPPDILVEVISSGPGDARRDRIDKAEEYAAFGVPFYWIVDPGGRTLEVFALDAGRYLRILGAAEGMLDVPGCEGLRLDLGALWAHVQRH